MRLQVDYVGNHYRQLRRTSEQRRLSGLRKNTTLGQRVLCTIWLYRKHLTVFSTDLYKSWFWPKLNEWVRHRNLYSVVNTENKNVLISLKIISFCNVSVVIKVFSCLRCVTTTSSDALFVQKQSIAPECLPHVNKLVTFNRWDYVRQRDCLACWLCTRVLVIQSLLWVLKWPLTLLCLCRALRKTHKSGARKWRTKLS